MTERRRCKRCGSFTTYTEGDMCFKCLEEEEADYYERKVEEEICPECGVVHGPNPYTGCGR